MIIRVRVVNAFGNFYSSEVEYPQMEDITKLICQKMDKRVNLKLTTDNGSIVIGPEILRNSVVYVEEMGE